MNRHTLFGQAQLFCLNLVRRPNNPVDRQLAPNVLHWKLQRAVEKRFLDACASGDAYSKNLKIGVDAIESLVADRKIQRQTLKVNKSKFVWYHSMTSNRRQQVLHKLMLQCRKGEEAPKDCICVRSSSRKYMHRDILCADVVESVRAARPMYAHELCEMLVERGVLPSPRQLSRLCRHLNISVRHFSQLRYGPEPPRAAAASGSEVDTIITSSSAQGRRRGSIDESTAERYCKSLVAGCPFPNVLHRRLKAAIDRKYTPGTAASVLAALVQRKEVVRRHLKVGRVRYVWYHLPVPYQRLEERVVNELLVKYESFVEPPNCICRKINNDLYYVSRDVLCADVVESVRASQPMYAHELCEMLVERGVLPSSRQLLNLYRYMNISVRRVTQLRYGPEPQRAAATAGTEIDAIATSALGTADEVAEAARSTDNSAPAIPLRDS